jgi:ribosome maturation factor RimP
MAVSDKLRELIEPLVVAQGLDLFDIEHNGGMLRVTVEREGGADMQAIAAVTRSISRALDERDPIAGRYTLEVSSPGLERSLRTPSHFQWAIGQKVRVKTVPSFEGERRFTGDLVSADDDGFDLCPDDAERGTTVRLAYADIDKARTVFEWAGAPKPGSRKQDAGRKPKTTKTTKTTKRAKAS